MPSVTRPRREVADRHLRSRVVDAGVGQATAAESGVLRAGRAAEWALRRGRPHDRAGLYLSL